MPAPAGRQRLARAFGDAAWSLALEIEATQEELREAHGVELAARMCEALACDPRALEAPGVVPGLAAHALLSRDVPPLDAVIERLRTRLAEDSALVAQLHAQPLRAWRVWPPHDGSAGHALPLGLEDVVEPRPIETLALLGGECLDEAPGAPHVVLGWRVEIERFCGLLALARVAPEAVSPLLAAIEACQEAVGRVGDGSPEALVWEAIAGELVLVALATAPPRDGG